MGEGRAAKYICVVRLMRFSLISGLGRAHVVVWLRSRVFGWWLGCVCVCVQT